MTDERLKRESELIRIEAIEKLREEVRRARPYLIVWWVIAGVVVLSLLTKARYIPPLALFSDSLALVLSLVQTYDYRLKKTIVSLFKPPAD